MACVRVPHEDRPGRRRQEIREYATLSRSLLELADWLHCERVELVAMEATSDYWKPVFYLLEAEGFTCWLLNAKHVKNVPGRPKTLEDAQIKLSSVISDVFGVSGRQMLAAMIAGQRSPKVLAQMARGSMRSKTAVLEEALTGHFEDHHGFLLQAMLEHVDALTAQIDAVSVRIEAVIGPFSPHVERLDEITGVGLTAAQELIAEIGVDATRFPSAAHLVSWAKFAPIDRNSAGRKRGGSTGKGNPWLAGTLGEIVASLSRTDTFLGERYRRLARRIGKSRAIVAVGNSVLTIIWHLLDEPDARYQDLGADFYQTKLNTHRRERDLIRQLEHLTGKKVTLEAAAAA